MFYSETEMKEYLIKNIDLLKNKLLCVFGEDEEIVYLGDEIPVPTGRIDMLFYSTYEELIPIRDEFEVLENTINFYVIELKNRHGQCQDIGQLSRYINGLNMLLLKESNDTFCDWNIYGILLCTKQSEDLKDLTISSLLQDIFVWELSQKIEISDNCYEYTNKFKDSIKTSGFLNRLILLQKQKNEVFRERNSNAT